MTTESNENPGNAPEFVRRNKLPKFKKAQSYWSGWRGAIDQDNYNKIRDDYLSGNFTIEQLVEKYDIRVKSLLFYVRKQWKPILIERGLTPPKEPRVPIKRFPPQFWHDVEVEYRQGSPIKELAAKYNVHPLTIVEKAGRYGWASGRSILPGFGARSHVTPMDVGIRMENFTQSVRSHIEYLLASMVKYRSSYHKRVKVEEVERLSVAFAAIAKSFASVVETARKLYTFSNATRQAEDQAVMEGRRETGLKAMEDGLKPGSRTARPLTELAVPIRIEKFGVMTPAIPSVIPEHQNGR
jgi:hypothetical protein